jgi:hypothetical protein
MSEKLEKKHTSLKSLLHFFIKMDINVSKTKWKLKWLSKIWVYPKCTMKKFTQNGPIIVANLFADGRTEVSDDAECCDWVCRFET